MQSAEHVYMSQLKAWPYAVLHMIRITIPGCVVLLDLAHVQTEYFLEKKKGSINEEYWGTAWSGGRLRWIQPQINEAVNTRAEITQGV